MAIPWPEMVMPLVYLVWGLTFGIYITFPLYENRLRQVSRHPGFIFFDFGRGGIQAILWFIFMACLIIYSIFYGDISVAFIGKWGLFSFIMVLILCMDLTGSTPVIKSAIHDDISFNIYLNHDKCRGAAICTTVCPRGCFELLKSSKKISIQGIIRCIKCGACIVQCPNDALGFKSGHGTIVPPDIIRKFKLNLLGKRPRITS
jgi:NAD-dependent dihydropyrimidine dehydrogenase PreA subunit